VLEPEDDAPPLAQRQREEIVTTLPFSRIASASLQPHREGKAATESPSVTCSVEGS
jgi:hypothetical protein